MKIQVKLPFRQRNQGYAALAMVAVVGVSALLGLMFVFRGAMRSHESQVRNQVKIDYRQKEDALLRALVAIVPNKVIGAMMEDSRATAANFTWDQIFTEAMDVANTENALNAAVVSSFGITGIINANTGDMTLTNNSQIVSVIPGSNGTLVGPGSTTNVGLLNNPDVGTELPQALAYTGFASDDNLYPIISADKTYPATAIGLGASPAVYPVYNLIPYPNIQFGMVQQGQNFIAKRNWWAFSLEFGNGITLANNTGTADSAIPTVTKNYVLSIYEVPSQLGLTAGTKVKLGKYADGSAWNGTITGGAFGTEIDSDGLTLLGNGNLSSRRSITINGATTAGGQSISAGFANLGTREVTRKTSGSDFYGASSAGDSGKVAILPLGQGAQFIRRDGAVPKNNTISTTGWFEYATGSLQCKMGIEILEMDVAPNVNRPIHVRFHYFSGGVATSTDFQKNVNWENNDHDLLDNPVNPPFYWENLALTTNPALTIKLDEFKDFLKNVLAADDLDVNNSLAIWSNTTGVTVNQPQIPSVATDMAVVVRGGVDMTQYTAGFSIVTDHRIYIAEDINQVPTANPDPIVSGYPGAQPYYPPVSIYAADKRFGTAINSVASVNIVGQLTSLAEDDGSTINPLDGLTGTGNNAVADGIKISGDLTQMVSPAELPPVNKMTWLVVIEEIQSEAP